MKINRIDGQHNGMEEMQRRLNTQFQNVQMSNDQQTVLQNAIKAIDNVQQSQVQNISGTVI